LRIKSNPPQPKPPEGSRAEEASLDRRNGTEPPTTPRTTNTKATRLTRPNKTAKLSDQSRHSNRSRRANTTNNRRRRPHHPDKNGRRGRLPTKTLEDNRTTPRHTKQRGQGHRSTNRSSRHRRNRTNRSEGRKRRKRKHRKTPQKKRRTPTQGRNQHGTHEDAQPGGSQTPTKTPQAKRNPERREPKPKRKGGPATKRRNEPKHTQQTDKQTNLTQVQPYPNLKKQYPLSQYNPHTPQRFCPHKNKSEYNLKNYLFFVGI